MALCYNIYIFTAFTQEKHSSPQSGGWKQEFVIFYHSPASVQVYPINQNLVFHLGLHLILFKEVLLGNWSMDFIIKKGFTALTPAFGTVSYVKQPQVILAHDGFIVGLTMFCV